MVFMAAASTLKRADPVGGSNEADQQPAFTGGDASQAASSLAERIETEAHRGKLAAPGQDLELDHEEQRELLEALKATTEAWPEEDKSALRELQLALTFQLSQPEHDQT